MGGWAGGDNYSAVSAYNLIIGSAYSLSLRGYHKIFSEKMIMPEWLDYSVNPRGAIVKYPNSDTLKSIEVIPPDILESATERLRKARDRYNKSIRLENIEKIKHEFALTRAEICFILSLVLKHNSGEFPTSSGFDDLWVSFGCTEIYPEFGRRN